MNNREGGKVSFIKEIIGCLISPRSTFRSILEKPSLMKATALILVIAIVAAWASFNYAGKLPLTSLPQVPEGQFPGQGSSVNSEQLRQAWMVISTMTTVIGIFAIWFISSVLVHGFSRTLGGKGYFKNLLTLAGYASTPLFIQHVLRLVDSFMVSQEGLLQIATSLQISAYPLLNSIASAAVDIFTIFRVWSMVLLIIATRENYKISTTRATVATVATVLAFIIVVFISAFLPFI